jgi:replicative DNA helicase
VAELHIAKQRSGPLGIVPVQFDAPTTRFGNLLRR